MKKYTLTFEQLDKIFRILFRIGSGATINEIRELVGMPKATNEDSVRWTHENCKEREAQGL